MSKKTTNEEFNFLVSVAELVKKDFIDPDDPWEESPFGWIKKLPPRTMGKLGEDLIRSWCAVKSLAVDKPKDSEADLLINEHRVEVKFSTLWKAGFYKFQQLRDQDYEYAVCLGVSPFNAHCWVISKEILKKYVIGHQPQHGGSQGSDTFWFSVYPEKPLEWLKECGGSLEEAFNVLNKLSPRKRKK